MPWGVVLDRGVDSGSRAAAADAVRVIGEENPGARDSAVSILVAALERWEQEPIDITAVVACGLMDLGAREAAPLIRRAVAAGRDVENMAGHRDEERGLSPDEDGAPLES